MHTLSRAKRATRRTTPGFEEKTWAHLEDAEQMWHCMVSQCMVCPRKETGWSMSCARGTDEEVRAVSRVKWGLQPLSSAVRSGPGLLMALTQSRSVGRGAFNHKNHTLG